MNSQEVTSERGWADTALVPAPMGDPAGRSVALVGAGIVNLMTALKLVRAGYQVSLYDRAPDPRGDAHWDTYGCTRGGGDGRMFTLTEADTYNYRSWDDDGTTNNLLGRPIGDHGWKVAKRDQVAEERHWTAAFHGLPPWLAASYNDDIFAMNRIAGSGWTRLMTEERQLFTDDTGYRDGILRLYTNEDDFAWHVMRNRKVGAVLRELSADDVCETYPGLKPACLADTIVGGLEVVGFTVNIHRFLRTLVDELARAGAQFNFECEVTGIAGIDEGNVDATGLRLVDGRTVEADHYVLSPGAYGNDLLRGTQSHGRIQGMLGVWVTVPNIEPELAHSVKIARKGHVAEETNVTLAHNAAGESTLVCGSGYGWTGLDPTNIDPTQLDELYVALDDTVRLFFPHAYEQARRDGTLQASRRHCVRPWTSSCLGVFETVPAAGGGRLIVTGGHNTGGFAQSPAVADAVLDALEGRPNAMHTRYHPARADRYR